MKSLVDMGIENGSFVSLAIGQEGDGKMTCCWQFSPVRNVMSRERLPLEGKWKIVFYRNGTKLGHTSESLRNLTALL